MDVVTSDFLSLGRKHYLVPEEAVSEVDQISITLEVDQKTVERSPTFSNLHVGLDEEYQRTIREHYGLGERFTGEEWEQEDDIILLTLHRFRS